MTSTGVDASTGQILTGWGHVAQSLAIIITTDLRSRVERRDFGSVLPRLLDAPQNEGTLMDFRVSIAEAIQPRVVEGKQYGEPRFRLERIDLDPSTPGKLIITVEGTYLPFGHLGDDSRSSPQRARLVAGPAEVNVLEAA